MTTTLNTIECGCGIRSEGTGTIVWVRSPRTGKTLDLTERLQSGMPAGMRGRIVQAAAVGCHKLPFTRDELRALAELVKAYTEATTLRPGGYVKPNRGFSARY